LKAVNVLYKENKFTRFGLSNYAAWQVAEIYELCDKYGYVKPTVYQGMYNMLTRDAEKELFTCLRHYHISFYAFNPLAGGMFSGKYKFEQLNNNDIPEGGRYSGNTRSATILKSRYWHSTYFESVEMIKEAIHKIYDNKISLIEVALRWLQHHSMLNENDGIIIGASNYDQFAQNIHLLQSKEPLHKDLVDVIDNAWHNCKGECVAYFRQPNQYIPNNKL